jgi:uncharacterized pyridoxamine 5'-phosphate oxidase family protein
MASTYPSDIKEEETMNKRSRWIRLTTLVTGLTLLSAGLLQAAMQKNGKAAQGVDVGPGEMGISAVIIPGPPLTGDQVRAADHRDYPRGMTCAECHDVTFDGITSATMQFVNNFGKLEQEEIWSRIVDFLPGRERFAIATVKDGIPIATTVDMVLDPEERVLYVVSEKGTEKLTQLRANPNISAVRFQGWTVAEGGKKEWISVQIRGTAEIIESDDERFMDYLEKYNLVRLTPERAVRRFDLIRVTPQQIYYFNTNLGAAKKSVYQLWQRDGAGT